MKDHERERAAEIAASRLRNRTTVLGAEAQSDGGVTAYIVPTHIQPGVTELMRSMDYAVDTVTEVITDDDVPAFRVRFIPVLMQGVPVQNVNPPCQNCGFSGFMSSDQQTDICPECGERP